MYPAEVVELVAGYRGFGFVDFGRAIAVCVTIAVPIRMAVGRSDLNWLDVCAGHRAQNLLHRTDLHYGFAGLLQHQLFVNLTNLRGLFERLLTPNAVFFSSGLRNIVLEFANA